MQVQVNENTYELNTLHSVTETHDYHTKGDVLLLVGVMYQNDQLEVIFKFDNVVGWELDNMSLDEWLDKTKRID